MFLISKDSLLMRCEVSMDQEVGVNNHSLYYSFMHSLRIPIGSINNASTFFIMVALPAFSEQHANLCIRGSIMQL